MSSIFKHYDDVIGTDVKKCIDTETGNLILKFKPTEEFKKFVEDIKNKKEKTC